MCLSTVYSGKRKQAALDKLPKMGTYWKVVERKEGYFAPYYYIQYHSGMMTFKTNRISYDCNSRTYKGGVHIYINKADALDEKSQVCNEIVVPIKVKKAWITTIGLNDGSLTICASKAIFPKWIGKKK